MFKEIRKISAGLKGKKGDPEVGGGETLPHKDKGSCLTVTKEKASEKKERRPKKGSKKGSGKGLRKRTNITLSRAP